MPYFAYQPAERLFNRPSSPTLARKGGVRTEGFPQLPMGRPAKGFASLIHSPTLFPAGLDDFRGRFSTGQRALRTRIPRLV